MRVSRNRKNAKPRRRIPKTSAKAVTSIVKSVMNKELESKYAAQITNYTTFNSIISTFAECYPAMPFIGPSSSPAQTWLRAGDSISPMTLNLKVQVALAHIARTASLRVHLFVLTSKQYKNLAWLSTAAASAAQPFMFSNGAGGISGYNGLPTDAMQRYNFNDYTILAHKSHVLIGNVGFSNEDTTAGNAPNTTVGGTVKKWNIKIKCPKTLKYTEGSGAVYPNNFAPFFAIGYEKLDGSSPDIVNKSIVANWSTQLLFKDA